MEYTRIDKLVNKLLGADFLSLRVALALFLIELFGSTLFYILYEGYSFTEGLYMAVIVISTVGFGEVKPLSSGGQLYTIFFIMMNIGIFAYTLSAFSFYVIQGELFKNMYLDRIKHKINDLDQHVIICGFGRYGKEIATNFKENNVQFVVVEHNEDKIEKMAEKTNVLFVHGDSTDDDILIQAGIHRALALISALEDDTENLYTMLTARELNPKLNLISRAQNKRAQHKLLLAGASHVIMPEQIGGFYMATLVNKPDAAEFFNSITTEYESDMGYEAIHYEDLPQHCLGKSISELHLRKDTGVNIVGYKTDDDKYIVNPEPETVLIPGSSFIVLGNKLQLDKLTQYLEKTIKG